jgi:hypothetical protein
MGKQVDPLQANELRMANLEKSKSQITFVKGSILDKALVAGMICSL